MSSRTSRSFLLCMGFPFNMHIINQHAHRQPTKNGAHLSCGHFLQFSRRSHVSLTKPHACHCQKTGFLVVPEAWSYADQCEGPGREPCPPRNALLGERRHLRDYQNYWSPLGTEVSHKRGLGPNLFMSRSAQISHLAILAGGATI